MHYSSIAFSNNSVAKTVLPHEPQYEHTIGNRVEPSFLDYKELNMAYCSNICRNTLPCKHGGYPNPNACQTCLCPTGLCGRYCEQLMPSKLSHSGASSCYWRITANPGDRIRFELTNVFFKCAPTCEEFVEIKFARTHDRTGLRECCRAEYGEVVSQGDSILVITLATTSSQFNLRYRLGQ
ncbi:hypothetical protein COOONC_14507 [Cooperia oncophora]